MHGEYRARAARALHRSIVLTCYVCSQSDSEFSIGQPLGYATNHKGAPLSHNDAVITSGGRGTYKITF